VTSCLLLLQTITTLYNAHPGPGLPDRWSLTRIRHVEPPRFSVTPGHTVRVEADAQAGFASLRLRTPLRPAKGRLTWKWRTGTPLPDASLHSRQRDDSPVRVFLVFDDGRMLYYTWGNREPIGDTFHSWTGETHGVMVLRRAEDANGSWCLESRDPFEDYRRTFNHAPHPIVAVGVGADTDQLHDHTVAEVGEMVWE
jgi:hypothetical protein